MKRAYLVIMIVVSFTAFAEAAIKGDANGDGVVDGKDALMTLMVAEGRMDKPEDSDPFWDAADVHPLPGTDGNLIGDGKITPEDAQKILLYTVGVIGAAELNGDFDGPVITDFSPRIGSAGTKVTIKGANFVIDPGENAVDFAGVPAKIVSSSPNSIETEVPAGATTGPIRVRSAGGVAISRDNFQVTTIVHGIVTFPTGLRIDDYDVASSVGVGSLDDQGRFSVPVRDGMLTVIGVVPKTEDAGNGFLTFSIPGVTPTDGVEIDARSTAKALILCQPMFLTDDPNLMALVLQTIETTDEVDGLEALIESKWATSSNPLVDPEVENAIIQASLAVNDALPEIFSQGVPGSAPAIPEPQGVHYLDTHFLNPKLSDKAVTIDRLYGNPVDWFVRLSKVDPEDPDFAQGPYKVRQDAVFDRLDYHTFSTAAANAFYAKLDLLDLAIKELFGALGLSDTPRMDLDDDEDAVYVLRMFSGVLIDYSPGKSDSELMKRLPGTKMLGYPIEMYQALAMNITLASLDAVGIIIDLQSLLGGDSFRKVVVKMQIAFQKEFAEQFPASFDEIMSMSNTELMDKLGIIGIATIKEGIKTATKELILSPLKALLGIFKTAIKTIDILGKVAKVGKLRERLWGLVGGAYELTAVHGQVTPLESAMIVVGDPFGPRIDSVEPREMLPRDIITLRGKRFSPNPSDNTVMFGNLKARVVSVKDRTEIQVEVPMNIPSGLVKISAMTPKGGPNTFNSYLKILRRPKIVSVTPAEGFAATDNFLGAAYPGTKISIIVDDLELEGDQPDEVHINGQKVPATMLFGKLEANIPAGAGSPGDVIDIIIKAPSVVSPASGKMSESDPFAFKLIGKPRIDEVKPAEAVGNQSVSITGENFGSSGEDTKVLFDDSYYGQIVSQSHTAVEVLMNVNVPEDSFTQLKVVTPAGESNQIEVKRLKGLAAGAYIPVREGMPPDSDYQYITLERALLFASGQAVPYDDADRIYDEVRGEWISLDPPYEEEDQISYAGNDSERIGAGYADVIAILGENHTYTPVISLSDYDKLRMGLNNTFTGGIVLNSKGSLIEATGDIFYVGDELRDFHCKVSGGIKITGTENTIKTNVTLAGRGMHALSVDGGLLIDDGFGNEILDVDIGGGVKIIGGGLNVVATQYLNGSALFNDSYKQLSGYVDSYRYLDIPGGVEIKGSDSNRIEFLRVHDSMSEGVLLEDANHNLIRWSLVDSNAGNGIKIDRSNGNSIIACEIFSNESNGIHVTNGSKSNLIDSTIAWDKPTKMKIYGNKGDGVRISGDGNDQNSIGGSIIGDYFGDGEVERRNNGYGIAIIGASKGTELSASIGANRLGGLRLSGVRCSELQPMTIDSLWFDFSKASEITPVGIVIEDGSQNIDFNAESTNGMAISRVEHGIMIRGNETKKVRFNKYYVSGVSGSSQIGLLVTDGAYDVKIENSSFRGFSVAGIVIENLANNVEIVDSRISANADGIIVDNASDNLVHDSKHYHPLYSASDIYENAGNGIIVRNGSARNTFRSQVIKSNGKTGILVQKSDRTSIEGCGFILNQGAAITITDGSTNTSIGGAIEEKRNYITDNKGFGVLISGASAEVDIYGNVISGNYWNAPNKHSDWGIVIEGQSRNVRIGKPAPGAHNEITSHKQGGILVSDKGTHQITIWNNYVGLKQNGEAAGNDIFGIKVTGESGGSIRILENTISGNGDVGILFDADGTESIIDKNVIGMDAEKTKNVPNETGLMIEGSQSLRITNNTIAGNADAGLVIGKGARNNTIFGNDIYENSGNGVEVIENSTADLSGNKITANGGRGILLATGGNGMIPAPVIEVISPGSPRGKVQAPNNSVVSLFADPDDEGEQLIGTGYVINNRFVVRGTIPPGKQAHAFVTTPDGRTSEFGDALKPGDWLVFPDLVAFTSTRDGNMEIYAFEGNPDNPRRITDDPAADYCPRVSPDGGKIIFVSERNGNPDIWIYDRTTRRTSAITDDPAADYDPAWSPDGKRIAFVSERSGNPDIYLMNADGSDVTQLTTDAAVDRYPCWSPDGKMIGFASDRSDNLDIWTINISDKTTNRLTNNAAPDYRPSWTADGNEIAFTSERTGKQKIWSIAPDGTNVRQMMMDNYTDFDPAWSNGGRLLFVSDMDGGKEIWVLEQDGRTRRLTVSLGDNIQPDGIFYSIGTGDR